MDLALATHHSAPAPSSGLRDRVTATLYTSLSALTGIGDDWQLLLGRYGKLSPNCDPGRFAAVVEVSGNTVQPYVVVFRGGNGARAMIVGRTAYRRVKCPIGYAAINTPRLYCLDVLHGGILSDDSAAVSEAIRDHLMELVSTRRVDLLSINHLPVDLPLMKTLVSGSGIHGDLSRGLPQPHHEFEIVPGSFDDTIAHLSSKRRHEVQRENRVLLRFFNDDVEFVEFSKPGEADRAIAWASNISAETYKDRLGVGFEDTPRSRALIACDAGRGRFRGWFLVAKGRPIAFLIGSVNGDRCFVEAMGYVPEFGHLSPGKNVLIRAIERLCSEDVRYVDYGLGDAGYKRVFGTRCWDEVTLKFYSNGLRARVARGIDASAALASAVGRQGARALGGVDKVKRRWRRTLERRKGPGS